MNTSMDDINIWMCLTTDEHIRTCRLLYRCQIETTCVMIWNAPWINSSEWRMPFAAIGFHWSESNEFQMSLKYFNFFQVNKENEIILLNQSFFKPKSIIFLSFVNQIMIYPPPFPIHPSTYCKICILDHFS